jgi:hypothetical protein
MQYLPVTWLSYDALDTLDGFNLDNLGGSGDFKEGIRWPEYLTQYAAEWHLYVEAIRHAIIAGKVWAGGDWHQYSPHGVPVVAGEHFMGCGFRSWGDLLAAVWNTELGRNFSYLDFYMDARLPARPLF